MLSPTRELAVGVGPEVSIQKKKKVKKLTHSQTLFAVDVHSVLLQALYSWASVNTLPSINKYAAWARFFPHGFLI